MIHCWYRSLAPEFRTEQILYHCELPDSPTSLPEPPSTNDSDPDVFDHGACVDRPKWFLNHNAIMRKRITVSNWSVMARSSPILWLGTLHFMWVPSEYHNWRWRTSSQEDHSQLDTTDTVGEHHGSYHTH